MTHFRRKVFYLGGFDPRGARYYHGLYREAAERWGALTGVALDVSARRSPSPIQADWTVANAADGTRTSYSFLRWDDLIRRAWTRNPLTLAWRTVRTYAGLLAHFDLSIARRVPLGPFRTLFYPLFVAVLVVTLAGLVGFVVARVWLRWWAALPIGAVVGAAVAVPILEKLNASWLLRFFAFNARSGGDGDPLVAARLDAFAAAMLDDIAGGRDGEAWDEVLLVTHSNGSILAMPLMERLLAAWGGAMPDRFALVTFGQSIPLILCRADTGRFRRQLAAVGAGDFRWYDIGSPPDIAGFHGVNPMTLIGAETRARLVHLNPRFYRFHDAATGRSALARRFDVHENYLRVGDRASPLDYPAITATARPIEASVAAFEAL